MKKFMRFKIHYIDPADGETWKEEIVDFDDSGEISAKLWAEDYAYAASNKGTYEITKLGPVR